MSTTLTIKEAIEQAKQNPEGAFATELRGKIESGALDAVAYKQGIDLTRFGRPAKPQSLGSSFGDGNIFEQSQEEKGRVQKVSEGITGVLGGKSLAQGLGKSLVAPSVGRQSEGFLEQAQQQQSELISRIREKRSAGEDTTNLERALMFTQQNIEDAAKMQTDFVEAAPSNKEVIGSAIKLGATAGAGALAGGVSKGGIALQRGAQMSGGVDALLKTSKATTVAGGIARGTGAGAIVGAAEGAVQGAGTALENDDSVAAGVIGGTAMGAAGGAILGGIAGGVSTKFKNMSSRRAELAEAFDRPQVSSEAALQAKSTLAQAQTPDDFRNLLSEVDPKVAERFASKIDDTMEVDDIARVAADTLDEAVEKSGFNETNALFQINQNGKVVQDKLAKEAATQGMQNKDIALVKSLSADDKEAVAQMIDLTEQASKKRNSRVRGIDVVGKKIEKPLRELIGINKQQGKALDKVAKTLKGNVAEIDTVIDDFGEALENAGVNFVKDADTNKIVLDFTNSDFQGMSGIERVVKNVFNRLESAQGDAYEAHRLKRYIDSSVEYSKQADGMTGYAQSILKGLRSGVDKALDTAYPAYNQANVDYAKTRQAIDGVLEFTGTKFDLKKGDAGTQLGMIGRRMFGNNQNRVGIDQALQQMQDVTNSFSNNNYNSDFYSLVGATEMLEDIFGTQATTSLQGQAQRAGEQAARVTGLSGKLRNFDGLAEAGVKGVAAAIDAGRELTDENLVRALRSLVNR